MYPFQTSLIPVTIALTRFLGKFGFSAFSKNYPYWYLGSTPFKYLIGPITPFIINFIKNMLPDVSLFSITIYLVLFSFFFSAIGWLLLFFKLQDENYKLKYIFFTVLFLLFPWRYLSALAFDEASFTLARNLLPWILLLCQSAIEKKDRNFLRSISVVLSILVLLLINTSILPILIVGLVSLAVAGSFRKGKVRTKRLIKKIKLLFLLLTGAFFISTLWYGVGYWITILFNPSIGGISAFRVFIRIFDLLKAVIPLVLAVGTIYFSGKLRNKLYIFISVWLGTFAFLTIFRFIGDPDFWMDWTGWFPEIEVGMIILIISRLLESKKIKDIKFKQYFIFGFLFLFTPLISIFIWFKLGKPALLSKNPPETIESLDNLSKITGDRRVFLSGSTVFWADAMHNIYQVRGGRDQVAVNSNWDKAAYEIREGRSVENTEKWLSALDIEYVLIHTNMSHEYYHDFKNLEKWKGVGNIIWKDKGDIILAVQYPR